MNTRTKNSYETYLWDFLNEIFIICPMCSKKALVKRGLDSSGKLDEHTTRMFCTQCGYNKSLDNIAKNAREKQMIIMIKISGDPYFGQPLWLSERVGDEFLWAYNYNHLDFLKKYVEANLRERNLDNISNKSLGSRLPKWINSKKNRLTILKVIQNLENK